MNSVVGAGGGEIGAVVGLSDMVAVNYRLSVVVVYRVVYSAPGTKDQVTKIVTLDQNNSSRDDIELVGERAERRGWRLVNHQQKRLKFFLVISI